MDDQERGAARDVSSGVLVTTGRPTQRLWGGLGLILGFSAISIAIWSGILTDLDHRLLLAFRLHGDLATPIGPAWLAETERDITGLGSNSVMIFIMIAATGGFALVGEWRGAFTMIGATASAEILCAALKAIAQRPRPELIPEVPRVFTTSFPSSHAMISAATLFTLAALIARVAHRPAIRRYAFAVAAFATLMIGASRLYLGLHWPSDVAAGWLAGLFCSWVCLIGSRSPRRGTPPLP